MPRPSAKAAQRWTGSPLEPAQPKGIAMPSTAPKSRARRLALTLLAASLSACASLPPSPPVVMLPRPHPAPPAELMEPVNTEDFSSRVENWLQRAADWLENSQRR